jgi:uncharacterized protein (DUF1330 family)
MRFLSRDAARSWDTDPEYQTLLKIRQRTALANLPLVGGLA